jgi:hypothetical protein
VWPPPPPPERTRYARRRRRHPRSGSSSHARACAHSLLVPPRPLVAPCRGAACNSAVSRGGSSIQQPSSHLLSPRFPPLLHGGGQSPLRTSASAAALMTDARAEQQVARCEALFAEAVSRGALSEWAVCSMRQRLADDTQRQDDTVSSSRTNFTVEICIDVITQRLTRCPDRKPRRVSIGACAANDDTPSTPTATDHSRTVAELRECLRLIVAHVASMSSFSDGQGVTFYCRCPNMPAYRWGQSCRQTNAVHCKFVPTHVYADVTDKNHAVCDERGACRSSSQTPIAMAVTISSTMLATQ